MTQINIPNEYSVELETPDIEPYAAGNTGIPYVWRFGSGLPGPNVMVSAVVHGNEPCGVIALDWLFREDIRPLCGSLTLAFMNVDAYHAFDPADPNRTRWLEEDMNRVWDKEVLDSDRTSIELERARRVRPALEDIDCLLDIHSMQHLAPPLVMSGRHQKSKDLAARVGVPERIVGDAGHAAGRRMRDYGAFDDPNSTKTALLIECGQHWEASSGALAVEATVRFLAATGTIAQDRVDALDPVPQQSFYTVARAVTIESDTFTFAQPFTGGEVLPDAGTLIGHDGDTPVTTPADNTMLVMPSKRLWKGQTAVRFAVPDRPG
ncbi:succinylglutamate desuccinylase/aspartoacylase domain-containing protein [Roseobacter sp. S98]|uniref:succinylglutamate desuccinylase/aspartoacylase domain-containing protein n=1 Tax=Roseobacter algicola (ex Choi et al. 2025) (nom. illeg.) TaxID=3092138 RepID=UPI0035C66A90